MSLLDQCLSLQLGRAWRFASRGYAEPLKPYGLTPTQLLVLLALEEQDGSSQNDLALRVALDKATLSGVLDRLVRQDYIDVTVDEADARIHRPRLTAKAKSVLPDLVRIFREVNDRVMERLGPDRLDALRDVLSALEATYRS